MPSQDYWDQFFNPKLLFQQLLGDQVLAGDGVEFGCGYGTFSFEALNFISGQLNALDIEADLVHQLKHQAIHQNQLRLKPKLIDFVSYGSQLDPQSQQLALIFNLLHLESPVALLTEAHRVLKPGGTLLLIHWRTDIDTPRGPSLSIRPHPHQCESWLEQSGFTAIKHINIEEACPFHYALSAQKPFDRTANSAPVDK